MLVTRLASPFFGRRQRGTDGPDEQAHPRPLLERDVLDVRTHGRLVHEHPLAEQVLVFLDRWAVPAQTPPAACKPARRVPAWAATSVTSQRRSSRCRQSVLMWFW